MLVRATGGVENLGFLVRKIHKDQDERQRGKDRDGNLQKSVEFIGSQYCTPIFAR